MPVRCPPWVFLSTSGSGNPWSALPGDLLCSVLTCSAQNWKMICSSYHPFVQRCPNEIGSQQNYDLLIGALCLVCEFLLLLPVSFISLWRQKENREGTQASLSGRSPQPNVSRQFPESSRMLKPARPPACHGPQDSVGSPFFTSFLVWRIR